MNTKVVGAAGILLVLIGAVFVYVSLQPPGVGPMGSSTSNSTSSKETIPEQNWLTYHADAARSGSTSVPNFTSAVQKWESGHLDGLVYAEPLVFGDSVFVATENNSVYALDVSSGNLLWKVNLGQPVSGSSLPCGDIDPSGITGTPVIDPTSHLLYAVAFLNPPHHVLFAIQIDDGTVRFRLPADPAGSNPSVQQERAALSLANGYVYIPYGGLFGDCGNYHGWVVGTRADGTGSMISYEVPTGREGGIWAPSGGADDSSGNLYVATGNGDSSTTFDHGDSVVKLSPSLQELGFFAPSNWAQLNQQDLDLGTAGPIVVANGVIFQIGKEGVGYLLNSSALGGIGGELFSAKVCDGAYGGLASSDTLVFIPCTNGLFAVKIAGSSFQAAWQSNGFFAGPPIVTGDAVWTVDRGGELHVFTTGGNPMFTLGAQGAVHFATPSSGAGEVFVAAGDRVIAFGPH